MKNLLLVATAALALLVTGCTPGAAPSPASTTAPPSSAETDAAPSVAPTSPDPTHSEPTAAESTGAQPAGGCPDDRYALVKFSERGTGSNELSATGNDLTALFAKGHYVLSAPGRSAYKLTNGSQQADMLLKGTMSGRYTGKGDDLNYTLAKSDGKVTLKAAGQSRSESMKSAASTLAPQGKVPTTCTGDEMTMELPLALLEFERH